MKQQQSPPSVPAAKAWQQMKELLEKELPVSKGNNNKRKYSVLLLLLLAGGCGIYTWFNNTSSTGDVVLRTAGTKGSINNQAPNNLKVPAFENRGAKTPVHQDENEDLVKAGEVEKKQAENKTTPLSSIALTESKNMKALIKERNSTNSSFTKMPSKTGAEVNAKTAKAHLPKGDYNTAGIEAIPTTKRAVNQAESLAAVERKDTLAIAKAKTSELKITKSTVTKDSNAAIKSTRQIAVVKKRSSFHYGLEWSLPLPFNNNTVFIEANANSRPLIAFIPSVWLSKELSAKSSIELSVNPYAQYLLNSRSVLQNNYFAVGAVSESNINQSPGTAELAQNFTLFKTTGVEAALHYSQKLSSQWSVACGIGSTWTNTGLFKETIIKNKTEVLKDSLFGVVKTDKEWQFVKNNFLTAKLNVAYLFKHYQAGLAVSKPFTKVYDATSSNNSPINLQFFFRWIMK